MPIWVNRLTRRRHASRECRGLALSAQMAADDVRDRIVELPDDAPADVVAAVEAFTVPCRLCVPGARKLGALIPFYFWDEGQEFWDEDEVDETGE